MIPSWKKSREIHPYILYPAITLPSDRRCPYCLSPVPSHHNTTRTHWIWWDVYKESFNTSYGTAFHIPGCDCWRTGIFSLQVVPTYKRSECNVNVAATSTRTYQICILYPGYYNRKKLCLCFCLPDGMDRYPSEMPVLDSVFLYRKSMVSQFCYHTLIWCFAAWRFSIFEVS